MLCLCLSWNAAADSVQARLQEALQGRLQAKGQPPVSAAAVPLVVAEFYAQRQWLPVWDDQRFALLLNQLAELYTDGLNPEDYGLARLRHYQTVAHDPLRASERELLATHAGLLALVHLYHGKVNPQHLDPHWNFDKRPINPPEGLQQVNEALEQGHIDTLFQRARPTFPQYELMRQALARLRNIAQQGGWPMLAAGAPLKPGANDPRIPALRQRLQAAGLLSENPDPQSTGYDDELVSAVQRFQRESYLQADGVLGPATLRELNVPLGQRIGQLRANLERMRWYGQALKGDVVIVDVAGYRLAYMRDNQVLWQSRVQVGKAYRKTPIFKSTITHLTLNPTWTVPPTILQEDALPAIRRDQNYLKHNRLRVFDARGQELLPAAVNWAQPGPITLRQDAGPGSALGQVAIRFPNAYSVYLHETPHQALFDAPQRAFSSGCIRVENIRELALLLLNDPQIWSRPALEQVLAEGRTRDVMIGKKIPLLIAYWTVDTSEDGYVSFKPDVYGMDQALLQALDKPVHQ